MRTSALSGEGFSAGVTGRSGCIGSELQAVNKSAAVRRKTLCDRDTMDALVSMEPVMRRFLACALISLGFPICAYAALDIGDSAPDFTTEAALGGSVYRFSLAESLKKGPVVLYFFPAAYSEGCSLEAHYFADAVAQFKALGASVVGVSGDDIETLSKFSVQACQSRFPVASDQTQAVMKSFDAVMQTRPEYANRISYLIAPNGIIVYHYMSLNPTKHVENTLAALRSWAESKK
jgi:peroxiredoxin Q/BCP